MSMFEVYGIPAGLVVGLTVVVLLVVVIAYGILFYALNRNGRNDR